MKSKDLMIGDWVYVPHNGRASHNGKVEAIYESGTISVELEEAGCLCRAESLAPIPLTPEILEKNGFSGEGYNMGVVGFSVEPIPDEKDGYEVFIWKDMCLQIKHGFTHFKKYIKYVHELQHALRLCGISKDITL